MGSKRDFSRWGEPHLSVLGITFKRFSGNIDMLSAEGVLTGEDVAWAHSHINDTTASAMEKLDIVYQNNLLSSIAKTRLKISIMASYVGANTFVIDLLREKIAPVQMSEPRHAYLAA